MEGAKEENALPSSRAKDKFIGINYVSHRINIILNANIEAFLVLGKRMPNRGWDKFYKLLSQKEYQLIQHCLH